MNQQQTEQGEGESDSGVSGLAWLFAIFGGIFAIWLAVLVIACICCCNRKPRDSEKNPNQDDEKKKKSVEQIIERNTAAVYTKPKTNPDVWNEKITWENKGNVVYVNERANADTVKKSADASEIESDRLTLEKSIGQGQFGVVYKGRLTNKQLENPQTVAVKTIQGNGYSQEDMESFMEEVERMRGFNHKHVLSLLGFVIRDNKPYAVLPFMKHGDLKSYISDPHNVLAVKHLLDMSSQIASGMQYLAEQNFIHRDLAARNCMVDEPMNVKISDFGLSHDIFSPEYYRTEDKKRPLPIRWMAIESIKHQIFTSKSDVWSYGILLWEMFTRGKTPYPGLTNDGVISSIKNKEKLARPTYASENIYQIMLSCWEENPDDRPSFDQIVKKIHVMMLKRAASFRGRASAVENR